MFEKLDDEAGPAADEEIRAVKVGSRSERRKAQASAYRSAMPGHPAPCRAQSLPPARFAGNDDVEGAAFGGEFDAAEDGFAVFVGDGDLVAALEGAEGGFAG